MPVDVVRITRLNPAPCRHYEVEFDIDGRSVTRRMSEPEMRAEPDIESLLLNTLRYFLGTKRLALTEVADREMVGDTTRQRTR